jgi:hypothetical protein
MGINVIVGAMLSQRILHKSQYDCHQGSYQYTIGNYTNIIVLVCSLYLLSTNSVRFLSRSMKLAVGAISFILSVVFQIVWNIIGLFWIFDAASKRLMCLSFVDLFIIILFQVITVIGIVVGISYLVFYFLSKRTNRRRNFMTGFTRNNWRTDPEAIQEMFVRKNLVSIYSQRSVTSKASINHFLDSLENQIALMKIPVLSQEFRLMEAYYQQIVDESLMDKLLLNEDHSCPICIGDFVLEQSVYYLPCGHCFHNNCVLDWLKVKISCPTCRTSLRRELIVRLTKDQTD